MHSKTKNTYIFSFSQCLKRFKQLLICMSLLCSSASMQSGLAFAARKLSSQHVNKNPSKPHLLQLLCLRVRVDVVGGHSQPMKIDWNCANVEVRLKLLITHFRQFSIDSLSNFRQFSIDSFSVSTLIFKTLHTFYIHKQLCYMLHKR